jgi:hypothetical protein
MKKKIAKKKPKPIQAWAFIDTNIYLDFYRSSNDINLPGPDGVSEKSTE